MDPLGNPLTIRPIQTGWEFTMQPDLSRQFRFIDDLDHRFDNGSVWTRSRIRSDGPGPLLTLVVWERTVQECSCARLCNRARSHSVRQTTKKFNTWWKPLSMASDVEWAIDENERQPSVNNLWFCKYSNFTVIWAQLCITDVWPTLIDERDSSTVTAPCREWVSTEHEHFVVL